jgi:hypothetical protein
MLKGCILGTGGGWMLPPTNSSNTCPGDIYTHASNRDQLGCPQDVPARAEYAVTSDVDRYAPRLWCHTKHVAFFTHIFHFVG